MCDLNTRSKWYSMLHLRLCMRSTHTDGVIVLEIQLQPGNTQLMLACFSEAKAQSLGPCCTRGLRGGSLVVSGVVESWLNLNNLNP